MSSPLAILGIPSIDEIISKIANGIFKALADALIPDWIKDAGGKFFTWLVNVPNPASPTRMPHLDSLHDHAMWLAVALLGLTSVAAAVRYTIGAMTADQNPVDALFRTAYAGAGLMLYQWAFVNAIALVNVLTAQIFAWPVVKQGANALGTAVFSTAVFAPQVASPITAIFSIIAFFIVIILIATKLAIFMVLSMLYVGGPLAIALSPIPEFSGIVRTWGQSVASVLMVPLLWTLMFATAGVFVMDLPRAIGLLSGSGVAGRIGSAFVSALAALIIVYLAMKVGTRGLSHVTRTLSGFLEHGSGGFRMSGFVGGLASGEARARVRGSVRAQAASGVAAQGSRRTALAAVTAAAGGASGAAAFSRAGAAVYTASRRGASATQAAEKGSIPGTNASPVRSGRGDAAGGSRPGDGADGPSAPRDQRRGVRNASGGTEGRTTGGRGNGNAAANSNVERSCQLNSPAPADAPAAQSSRRTAVPPPTPAGNRQGAVAPGRKGAQPAKSQVKPAAGQPSPKSKIEQAGAKARSQARSDSPAGAPQKKTRGSVSRAKPRPSQ